MNTQELVSEFVRLRLEVDQARKVYKEIEATNKEKMEELEVSLLEVSFEQGLDSFSTSTHTCFKTTKTGATLRKDSRDALIEYVKDTDDWGVFTNHVAKLHIKELIDDGFDVDSIGIDWYEERIMQVRKK